MVIVINNNISICTTDAKIIRTINTSTISNTNGIVSDTTTRYNNFMIISVILSISCKNTYATTTICGIVCDATTGHSKTTITI